MYFEINLFFLSGHLSGAHTHPFPGFTGPKMLPSEQEKKTDLDIGTTKLRLMSQKRFGASWALREEKDRSFIGVSSSFYFDLVDW